MPLGPYYEVSSVADLGWRVSVFRQLCGWLNNGS